MPIAQTPVTLMFTEILNRIDEFDPQVRAEPSTVAMLAQAIAEAWLIDEVGADLDTPQRAELASDLRLKALTLLEIHYDGGRTRPELMRDLQRVATSLSGNIFTNEITRFAGLATAVSEYIEAPDDEHMDDVLGVVVDTLHHVRGRERLSQLSDLEQDAIRIAAAWAARQTVPSARSEQPEDDAVFFLAAITAAAEFHDGVNPGGEPSRFAVMWAAFTDALRPYGEGMAALLCGISPSEQQVSRWMMVFEDVRAQLSAMVRIGRLLHAAGAEDPAPQNVIDAVEALAERCLGRPLVSRNKVQ